ncbi:MAG: zinc-ribbon domain-containing protein [Planctomycetes bacterium]|nr:zinc-ribbon domain-containing protein [Planctomycetota bacterium]
MDSTFRPNIILFPGGPSVHRLLLVMSVQVFCPKCDRSCRIKEELVGRRVRCPGCQEVFKAEEIPLAEDDPIEAVEEDDDDDSLPDFTPEVKPKDKSRNALPEKPKGGSSDKLKKSTSDKPKSDLPKKKAVKDESVVHPGEPVNPFDESSRLEAPPPPDSSLFEFEFGDGEPPPPKKKVEDKKSKDEEDDEDEEEERPAKRDRHDEKKRPAKSSPDTEYAWDEENEPPDEMPSKHGVSDRKGKPAPLPIDDEEEDEDDEEPQERPKAKERAAVKPPPPPPPKKKGDEASFFGLDDAPAAPPKRDEKAKPKKKEDNRKYFHVRQSSGFWSSDSRLFRVFIDEETLVFVTAASGKEIAEMEEALEAKSLAEFDKKIKNKVLDLEELSIDELVEGDRHAFRSPADKFTEASIDAASRGIKLLRKPAAASLKLVHKSKGAMAFEFPSIDDVDNALDFLKDLFGELLTVNVKWDKAKECFVGR